VGAADDPAERAAVTALDVITAAERTALDREREADERVQAAADVIRRMRTDVADLFSRVDQQIADLEQSLPDQQLGRHHAPQFDARRPEGELVNDLRRYELSVLSASQRTADHLREVAKAEAEELLAEARSEEQAVRQRIEELRAVEERLLGTVRDGLSDTPAPPEALNSNGDGDGQDVNPDGQEHPMAASSAGPAGQDPGDRQPFG
jgi:septum formation inhibitor MinC